MFFALFSIKKTSRAVVGVNKFMKSFHLLHIIAFNWQLISIEPSLMIACYIVSSQPSRGSNDFMFTAAY